MFGADHVLLGLMRGREGDFTQMTVSVSTVLIADGDCYGFESVNIYCFTYALSLGVNVGLSGEIAFSTMEGMWTLQMWMVYLCG